MQCELLLKLGDLLFELKNSLPLLKNLLFLLKDLLFLLSDEFSLFVANPLKPLASLHQDQEGSLDLGWGLVPDLSWEWWCCFAHVLRVSKLGAP